MSDERARRMVVTPTPTDTRHAKSGEYHIAHRVRGSGELDLIWFGTCEDRALSALFAATYPECTRALT